MYTAKMQHYLLITVLYYTNNKNSCNLPESIDGEVLGAEVQTPNNSDSQS